MLTTTEAAALLNERGYAKQTHKQGPITADAVKRQCYRGVYPNAKHYAGSGRGVWLIPVEDVERLIKPEPPANTPIATRAAQRRGRL